MKQKGGSQAGSDYPLGRMGGGYGQIDPLIRWRLFAYSVKSLSFQPRPWSGHSARVNLIPRAAADNGVPQTFDEPALTEHIGMSYGSGIRAKAYVDFDLI